MIRRAAPAVAAALATVRGFAFEGGFLASLGLVAVAVSAGAALTPASVDDGGRLATDLGWAGAGLLGWILAIGHGSGVLGGPGVVVPAALARPVSPSLLVLARFLGHSAGLALYAGIATALVGLAGGGVEALLTGWLLGLRLLVVLAVATALFACARPGLAAALAAALSSTGWLAGRLPGPEAEGWLRAVTAAARVILPDLSRLDAAAPGNGAAAVDATLYAALYLAGAVLIAMGAFPAVRLRSGR